MAIFSLSVIYPFAVLLSYGLPMATYNLETRDISDVPLL